MSAWKTASLGEIFKIARGGSPRPIQDYITDDPNGVNWISISDASSSEKFITETKKRIRPEGVSRSRMVKPGDFLLTNSMSFGRPYIMGTSGCIHDGWLVLSSKHGDIDQDYFFHLLGSDFVYAKFTKLAAGATVKNLNIDLVAGVEVNFPPLEEQRRIAAILDQAETLRTQRRATLAQLDTLTQSLFLDIFGDPVANDRGWPDSLTLGEVADIASGVTKGRNLEGKVTRELPYLAVANVQDKSLRLDGIKSIEATEDEIQRYLLRKNDLLLTEGGDPDKLGRGTLWNDELPECIHQNHIFRVRLTTELLTPLFLNWIVGSPRGKKYFLRSAKQTTGIASINMTQLKGFPLLVPPLTLQQTFATRIQAIEALKATHRTALVELDALFASLQQRAFSGELTRSASGAVATHTTRDLSAMCTLDIKKMLEALIYVAQRMPEHDFYKSLKALYTGDRQHLEHHGCLIYGETYEALDHGPVPKAAYALTKKLEEAASSNLFADDAMSIPLQRTGNQLVPARDADFGLLSAAERKSLDWAIKYYGPMNFGDTKTASHDSAYLATAPNAPLAIEAIIRTLPEAAQRRFFG